MIFMHAWLEQDIIQVELVQNIPDRFIQLPKEFATCIGFDETEFPTGTFIGQVVAKKGCYIDSGQALKLTVTINHWKQSSVVTNETKSNGFEELLTAISDKVSETDVQLGFIHEFVNGSIVLEVMFYEDNIKLKLSDELNVLFADTPSADIICPDRDGWSYLWWWFLLFV